MIMTLVYIALAILTLSFLIFIHELGHYFMARRVGMKVETFAIGFGKPIWSFERKGVKWQIGWLPFGGYVKIAGMENEGDVDPYSIKEGFFGKAPWDRIKVAVAGPFVNIVFAFFIFAVLWLTGGREKTFSEYTKIIGWVDPNSSLYHLGIRPGDEISAYDGQAYQGVKDHIYAPMTAANQLEVKGFHFNEKTQEKVLFSYSVKPYDHPNASKKGILTSGILQPANYLIYHRVNGKDNPLPEGSPMEGSGIEYGDRLVWIDGQKIYSAAQLESVLNDDRVFLAIKREGKKHFVRVPRVPIYDLRLDALMKEELVDWQFEASLNKTPFEQLFTIPYNLDNEARVEGPVRFIDKKRENQIFPSYSFSKEEEPLLPGDKIMAINGKSISSSFELLKELQNRSVFIIVERNLNWDQVPVKMADQLFNQEVLDKNLKELIEGIGGKTPLKKSGNLVLLNPVTPKKRADFALSKEKKAWLVAEQLGRKKEIEAIQDPEKRMQAKTLVERLENQQILGIPVQDRQVLYNPSPFHQFSIVMQEIGRTLSALLTGSMNPKWLSGPVGIVQVVYGSWLLSIKEAVFWIGAISLNLGILNLLPIPVLDGGMIVLSLFEWVTGKKIPPKSMEKVIFPFAVLLIGLFIYFTYNDLSRLFGF